MLFMLIISNFIWSQIDIRPVNNMWCIGQWFLIQQEGSNSEHEDITIKFKKMNICCNISNYGSFERKILNEEPKETSLSKGYISYAGENLEIGPNTQNSDKFSADSTDIISEYKSELDSCHKTESSNKTKAKYQSTYSTNRVKDYNKTTEGNTSN